MKFLDENGVYTLVGQTKALVDTKAPTEWFNNGFVDSITGFDVSPASVLCKYRISSQGNGQDASLPMPIANDEDAGMMPAAAYAQIQANTDAIAGLSGVGKKWFVGNLSEEPTQEELTDTWRTVSGAASIDEVPHGTQLVDLVHNNATYEYSQNGDWVTLGATTVSIATNDSTGVVKGTASGNGSVFVEADGTMSVNGFDGKVDVVAGKALSTNDYTTTEKTKLAGVTSGAQPNVLEAVYVNGVNQPINSKAVSLTVPLVTQNTGTSTTGVMFQNGVSNELGKKVDKVTGKALSTNDFTTAYKDYLDNLVPLTNDEINEIWALA
jgi:hypothetical protein